MDLNAFACPMFFNFSFLKENHIHFWPKCVIKLNRNCVSPDTELHGSVLDLYHNIITCDCFIRGVTLHEYLWDAVDLHSLNIPTLNNDYKANFSVQDWKKICFFDWHFSQKSGVHNLEYDQMLHTLHIFLKSLTDLHKLSQTLTDICKLSINHWKDRQLIGTKDTEIKLRFGDSLHKPHVIEALVSDSLASIYQENCGIVYCVDCTKKCGTKHKGVHLYIEISQHCIIRH